MYRFMGIRQLRIVCQRLRRSSVPLSVLEEIIWMGKVSGRPVVEQPQQPGSVSTGESTVLSYHPPQSEGTFLKPAHAARF